MKKIAIGLGLLLGAFVIPIVLLILIGTYYPMALNIILTMGLGIIVLCVAYIIGDEILSKRNY